MITNLFKKKATPAVEKMKFDEYFINPINDSYCMWLAVNYKEQRAITVQYLPSDFGMDYEIGWAVVARAKNLVQIPKSEFLEAYDRAIDYMKNARP